MPPSLLGPPPLMMAKSRSVGRQAGHNVKHSQQLSLHLKMKVKANPRMGERRATRLMLYHNTIYPASPDDCHDYSLAHTIDRDCLANLKAFSTTL